MLFISALLAPSWCNCSPHNFLESHLVVMAAWSPSFFEMKERESTSESLAHAALFYHLHHLCVHQIVLIFWQVEIIATCISLVSSIARGRQILLRWVGGGGHGLCFLLWEGVVGLCFLLEEVVQHHPLLFSVASSRDGEHMLRQIILVLSNTTHLINGWGCSGV